METGLYITFFETGEPVDRELPPVGPLEHVVVRDAQLIARRRGSDHAPEMGGDIAHWLEAQIEFQRATGAEPGGPKRTEMRFAARDGVLLRFAVFGDAREHDPVPEIGPYAVVVIGRRSIEADGQTLAKRGASEPAHWELAAAASHGVGGLRKPDVALRTPSTAYHPEIASPADAGTPSPVVPEPEPMVFRERERRPQEIYSARGASETAEEPAAPTENDLGLIGRVEQQRVDVTLRTRVRDEEKRRAGADAVDESAPTRTTRHRTQADHVIVPAGPVSRGFEIGPALWRLRFAIIGVLLLLVVLYGFTVLRGGGASPLR